MKVITTQPLEAEACACPAAGSHNAWRRGHDFRYVTRYYLTVLDELDARLRILCLARQRLDVLAGILHLIGPWLKDGTTRHYWLRDSDGSQRGRRMVRED